jgi:succinate-acetate transporter protein
MGIAYGGIAQIIVGIMEFKKGNTFGTVAFLSYGLFWWSLVLLLVLPKFTGFADPSPSSLAAYFIMWGLFTFGMFFGTLKANRALQFVFGSLTVLFFMLAIRELTNNFGGQAGSITFNTFVGIEGVICGLSAVYLGLAEVLNEVHHKTILPIYPTS